MRDRSSIPPGVLLAAACGFGLAFASVDQMMAIPWVPGSWLVPSDLVPSFATSAVVGAVSLVLGWLCLWPLLRFTKARYGCGLVGLVVFGLTSGSLLSWQHLLDHMDVRNPVNLAPVVSALLAALGMSAAAYVLCRRLSLAHRWGRLVVRLCLIAPVLLAFGTVWTWESYGDTPLRFGLPAAAAALAGLVCLGFWVRGSLRANSVLLVVLFMVPIVAGGLTYARRSPFYRQTSTAFTGSAHETSHFILITVDTLRLDALSSHNPEAPSTPNFDTLAEESIVFSNARSDASWTTPSVVSLLTGLPSLSHRVSMGRAALPLEIPTLAEYFRDSGYHTGAIVQNPLLNEQPTLFQGFAEYALVEQMWSTKESLGREVLRTLAPTGIPASSTEGVTATAEQWLRENRDRDFLLWIHYYDPHVPYAPPARYLPEGNAPARIGSRFAMQNRLRQGLRLSPEERDWVQKLYLAETRYVDDHIGRLVGLLRDLRIYDDAMIALTSDHGEEFWDHGAYEHGHSVYDELLRVPLFIKLPGSAVTGRVAEPVSNRFLMPTFLELAGIKANDRCSSPPSLSSLWQGGSGREFGPYTATSVLYYDELYALLVDDLKLIRSPVSLRAELYDLASDPGETRSVAGESDASERLGFLLDDLEEGYQAVFECYGAKEEEAPRMSPAAIERLRSLGYIH